MGCFIYYFLAYYWNICHTAIMLLLVSIVNNYLRGGGCFQFYGICIHHLICTL